jgi:hypothetical protein
VDLCAYIVSPAELLVMTMGAISSDGLVSGTIVSQASTSFDTSALNAPAVYYQLGVNPGTATPGTGPEQSIAEIGLMSPDGSGNLSVEFDDQAEGSVAKDQTFVATYAVLSAGRVTIHGWHGDTTGPDRILYLIDKNRAYFLDASSSVAFGVVEPQSAAPSNEFSSESFSGVFSTSTATPSVNGNLNGIGLATLDGAGSFSESTDLSTAATLFVDQATSGTYTVTANGRGAITSLNVSNARFDISKLAVALSLAILVGWRKARRNSTRPRFAVFCFAVLTGITPAGCPIRPITNQLVFYAISPKKAVMIHEQSFGVTPEITFIER